MIRDVKSIGHDAYKRTTDAIEKKLTKDPEGYTDPLRSPLQRLRKFKMSHVRVAVYLDDDAREVVVLLMADRAEIWDDQEDEILDRFGTEMAAAPARRRQAAPKKPVSPPHRRRRP